MKRFVCMGILAFAIVSGCATTKAPDSAKGHDSASTVVIIGGLFSTTTQMELLRSNFPGSVAVIPEHPFPLWFAADTVLKQIRAKNIRGKLVLIGYSWGGLIAREIDGERPGLVKAIITIGTPSGNFKLTPDALSEFVLRPRDSNSTTPLYIVGGYTRAAKRWWMVSDETDGVVDLSSILATGDRAVEAVAIYQKEHSELLQDPKVINQIRAWIARSDAGPRIVSGEIRIGNSLLSNRQKALLQWMVTTGFFPLILVDTFQNGF